MTTATALELVALVARELRAVLSQPSTIARLRLQASGVGAAPEEIDAVIARWQAMLARRESGEAPMSIRGLPS